MSDAQKLQAQQQFALQQGAINQQYSLQTLAQQNKYNIENGWGYDENIGAYVNVNTGEVRNIAQNYTKAQEAEYIANFIQ